MKNAIEKNCSGVEQMEDRISELTKEKEFKNNLVRIEQRKKMRT